MSPQKEEGNSEFQFLDVVPRVLSKFEKGGNTIVCEGLLQTDTCMQWRAGVSWSK
jgi:hypothetical protein